VHLRLKQGLKRVLAVVLTLSVIIGCMPVIPAQATTVVPKNVILLIGDGMGFEHVQVSKAVSVNSRVYDPPGTTAEIVDFTPDDKKILVTNSEEKRLLIMNIDSIDKADSKGGGPKVLADIQLEGEPTSVAVHPNPTENYALVTTLHSVSATVYSGKVCVVDLATNTVTNSVYVGVNPDSIKISPNGKYAVVANEAEYDVDPDIVGTVSILDLSGGKSNISVAKEVNLAEDSLLAAVPGINWTKVEPEFVAITPDSEYALVTVQEHSLVLVIRPDGANSKLAQVVQLPSNTEPDGIAISPDGKIAVTANEEAQSISILDLSDMSNVVLKNSPDILQFLPSDIQDPMYKRKNSQVDPEGVDMLSYNNRNYAVLALEDGASVLMLDVTDANNVTKVSHVLSTGTDKKGKPEGIKVSHNGRLIAVANEIDGTIDGSVAFIRVNPEAVSDMSFEAVDSQSGTMTTRSADAVITDSSSAATAMATGYKIDNNEMGQLPDGTSIPTILELAEIKGLATGVITTTQVAHATPAGFAAHILHRDMYNGIAAQMMDKGMEVVMGGGRSHFQNRVTLNSGKTHDGQSITDPTDSRNLITEAQGNGYTYVSDVTSLTQLDEASTNKVLGIFHDSSGLVQERKNPPASQPHLNQMTDKGLEILAKSDAGFFLMVEGGQIDWAAHDNDVNNVQGETLAFNAAVQEALDFQATHPNDTLVIVTADHETGGLNYDEATGTVSWSSTNHTATDVGVWAKGPGADQFNSSMDNTDIARKIASLMDLTKPLVVQWDSNNKEFTVTSLGTAVAGAGVKLDGQLAGITDNNGKLKYYSAAGTYSVTASKERYRDSDPRSINLAGANATPKNIVLLIGDGMGYEHMEAARDEKADNGQGALHMDSVNEAVGAVTTYSANAAITDSSSAATAIASGYKIDNNELGLLPDGTSVPTVLEMAEQKGLSTGLVTTTQIAHATPAGFAAHILHRDMYNSIAAQMIGKNIEVLMGGALSHFQNRQTLNNTKYHDYQYIKDDSDSRDLVAEAKAGGYTYVSDATALTQLDAASTGKVLGIFHASSGLVQERATPPATQPHLNQMTSKALDVLAKDSDGFFLMVEGGQIDWAAHANDLNNVKGETLAFDDAVKAALEFQNQHPDTLVIVTADHETGGLNYDPATNSAEWTSKGHTAANIGIWAKGPGDDQFNGNMDNTDIARKLAYLLSLPKPLVLQFTGVPGEAGEFSVTSYGAAVPGATVKVKGDTVGVTGSNGKLAHTFADAGSKEISAELTGYNTAQRTISVYSARNYGIKVKDSAKKDIAPTLTVNKDYDLVFGLANEKGEELPALGIIQVVDASNRVYLLNAVRTDISESGAAEYTALFQPETAGAYTVKGLLWSDWSNSQAFTVLGPEVDFSITVQ